MSEILVDNLTGKTSAGSITVYSEGGTVTQSLQQGLAKAWVNFNGTGTIAISDSLNVSGLDDNGTGNYTANFSNAFSASTWGCVSSAERVAGTSEATTSQYAVATGSIQLSSVRVDSGGNLDSAGVHITAHGDLA